MSLWDAFTDREIKTPRHRETWDLIVSRLTQTERNAVIAAITRLIIANHVEVTVPGFEAQSDWTNLPWQIVYEKAARYDFRLAALMFGLLAQKAFIDHPDEWYTGRTTYDGHEHSNAYYFRRKNGNIERLSRLVPGMSDNGALSDILCTRHLGRFGRDFTHESAAKSGWLHIMRVKTIAY